MADTTKIEWTDATWNPVTGCSIVDAGCTNCYAMQLAGTRLRGHPSRAGLTRMSGGRPKWTGEVRFNEHWLDQPLRWTRPRMIFVCAHGDLFHPAVPDEWIDRVFAVMALCPQHTFQCLTKRPERAREYMQRRDDHGHHPAFTVAVLMALTGRWNTPALHARSFPALPNVWIGTSVSDQTSADLRIPHLLATPAAVRFLSAEPLLGPVDIQFALPGWAESDNPTDNIRHPEVYPYVLDWVIVGGESGPGARVWPGFEDAARDLRDQCKSAGVAFFMKQMAGARKASMPPIPDDLMVREMPDAR